MTILYPSHTIRVFLQTVMQELAQLDFSVCLRIHGESDNEELVTELVCISDTPSRYRFHELLYSALIAIVDGNVSHGSETIGFNRPN